ALALQAQDIFGRILTLFTLFAFAIGLLLIFLIFSLLAAERRAELGVARAIGMRRSQIILMLLFEGSGYDVAAALFGMLTGLGLGVLIVALVSPVITQLGYPLYFSVQPEGMLVAFCLGALFTLATILLSAWNISRMTVAAALRDLPEPPAPNPGLANRLRQALNAIRRPLRTPGIALDTRLANAGLAWLRLLGSAITTGSIPLASGIVVLIVAIVRHDGLLFALGLSLTAIGAVLLGRLWLLTLVARRARKTDPASAPRRVADAMKLADRLAPLALGGGLALYWSLPFDTTQRLGLPHFAGGMPLVFVAGMMMVFGVVIALAPNLDLVLPLASSLLGRIGGLRHITAVALVYPALHRFRTGIGIALFSLVCFTLVVMACIAASVTSSYGDVRQMAAGYDISGQPLFRPIGGSAALRQRLSDRSPTTLDQISAISSATPVPLGVIQPGAPNAGWRVYPASAIDGAFLDGVGLPLAARAQEYTSDAAVWNAVRTHPGDVVIDASALSSQDADTLGLSPAPPISAVQFLGPPIAAGLPGLSNVEALDHPTTTTTPQGAFSAIGVFASDPSLVGKYRLQLRDIALGAGVIAPTPLWVGDLRSTSVSQVTIVGVIDNTHTPIYGMLGSPATFAPIEHGLKPFGNEYYYLSVKPNVETHSEARALGSALLDRGFETTDLRDLLLNINGPRIFLSRVLVGLVGLTLLVGMAALAVTGSRAVVERRQQIGMLRAIGFRRAHIQVMFFIESLLVGVISAALGLGLGLLLCRNVFAVNFFSAFTTDLTFVAPWGELALICGAAIAAAVLAALVPAWQADRIAPAEALRYE
ncbi:MAG TPA: FtsX-like permease family protein, partial [Ktedonobacterales bacterium]